MKLSKSHLDMISGTRIGRLFPLGAWTNYKRQDVDDGLGADLEVRL